MKKKPEKDFNQLILILFVFILKFNKKIIMKFLSIILLTVNMLSPNDCSPNILIKGLCGYPGKPYRAKLTPEKNNYNEGEKIHYLCDNYPQFDQHRQCTKGSWSGSFPVCGKYIKIRLKFK